MGRLEDLIEHVADVQLRGELANALVQLKRTKDFGLVYEDHIPEMTALSGIPIRVGSLVQFRQQPGNGLYRVTRLAKGRATLSKADATDGADQPERASVDDLLVVKRFGDPMYPALRSLGQVARGTADQPYHAVINGENFHALQLLVYLFEGRVDCIYVDPPFNTGAPDWKYNNRFVDKNDSYRHSKWLAMMSRRLSLANRLLKPDGVLVIAIDENEHAHLLLLLEKVLRDYTYTSIAIVHNPRGIQGDNFSSTNEYAVVCVPKGLKRIARRPLAEDELESGPLRNWGGESSRWDAATCFYPILVKDDEIVGFGDVLPDAKHPKGPNEKRQGGVVAVWPIDDQGVERKWRYSRESVEGIRSLLSVKHRGRGASGPLDVYLTKGDVAYKTVWNSPLYDASTYGTQVVNRLTATPFPFPKSVYAVYDVLHACTAGRADALIVDFFAGSGTTMHSTWLLNTSDGGKRRCILVTNNEVGAVAEAKLRKEGAFRGDAKYENEGIFEAVTRPRLNNALQGRGSDGKPLPPKLRYRRGDQRPWRQGFKENVEFFRLDYLDSDDVDLGRRDDALLPLLWLAAGAIGPRDVRGKKAFSMPIGSRYAVLFEERQFRTFLAALQSRPDVTHVWIVTDSEAAFSEMRSRLPARTQSSMLYRDYLRNFRVNVNQFA